MRTLPIVLLAALLTGCLAPGTRDPTRYPWDPRNKAALSPVPHPRIDARGLVPRIDARGLVPRIDYQPQPQPQPPGASFCIMAIEQERQTGITVSANSGVMTCAAPPNSAPQPPR